MTKKMNTYPLEQVLICSACEIAVNGWVSYKDAVAAGAGVHTTKHMVAQMLLGSKFGRDHQAGLLEQAQRTGVDLFAPEFKESILEVIEWARTRKVDSEYDSKISTIASVGVVASNEIGFAASMLMAYQREIEGRKAAYVGVVGDTIEETVVVTKITSGQGNHGLWHLTISETDNGDVIKWFSNKAAEYMEGDALEIRGTVKKHDEYKGTKSTQFGRVKILSGFGSKVT